MKIKTSEQIRSETEYIYQGLYRAVKEDEVLLKKKWISVDNFIKELDEITYRLYHDSSLTCWEEAVEKLKERLNNSLS